MKDLAINKIEVVEALYRFTAGLDLRDKDLLISSLAVNAISDFGPASAKAGFVYPILEGRDTIVNALWSSLSSLITTHSVSNPRVSISGEKALLEAIVEAQHVPRNDQARHYMMKNRYTVELVKSDDTWVIQKNTVDNFWRSGDPSVMSVV